MTDEEMRRAIEETDLLTEGEKETLMVLALVGEPRALEVVQELSRPSCPWTDGDECAAARERSVAGISDEIPPCVVHGGHVHDYAMSRYCGARVCYECDDHKGLDRCFCGWSRSGGNGRAELIEMGETIEPEDD